MQLVTQLHLQSLHQVCTVLSKIRPLYKTIHHSSALTWNWYLLQSLHHCYVMPSITTLYLHATGLHCDFRGQAVMSCHPLPHCTYMQLVSAAVITPGLHCAFRGQAVMSCHPLLQCTYMQLVSVAIITPGLHCAFRGQAVMQDFTKGYFGHLIWPWKHTHTKQHYNYITCFDTDPCIDTTVAWYHSSSTMVWSVTKCCIT